MSAEAPVETRADVVVIGDEALISLHGELDVFTVDVLARALDETRVASRVVVDMQDAPFVDSAALRCLEHAARERAAAGHILRVEHASGMVRRLIEILRMGDLGVR